VIREKDKLKTNAVCFHSTHFKDLCGPHYFSIRTSPIFILGSQLPAIFIFFSAIACHVLAHLNIFTQWVVFHIYELMFRDIY